MRRIWTRDSLAMPATTRNAANFAAESVSTYVPGQRLSQQITRRMSEVLPVPSLKPRSLSEPLARHASEWQGNTLQIEAGKSQVKGRSKHDFEKLQNDVKVSQAFRVAQALTVRALMIKGVSQANIAQTGLSVDAIKQNWEFRQDKDRQGSPETGLHFEEYHLRHDLHGKDSMTTKRSTRKFHRLHATEAEAHPDDENMVWTNVNGRLIGSHRVLLPAPLMRTASDPIVKTQSFLWQTPEHSERPRRIPAYVVITRSTFETRTRSEP